MKKINDINILFVDDEDYILSSMRRFLRRESYNSLFINNGFDALELLSTQPIDIIITDLRMPRMDGLELLEKVKATHPEIIRIVLSATQDLEQMSEAIKSGKVYRFMSKPLDPEVFRCNILDVVDYHLATFSQIGGLSTPTL